MNALLHRLGLSRLSILAASFVVLVCVAILGMSGWREWSSRAATLKSTEAEMANLARSLTQHAEDSFDLLDTSIVGIVIRLETDGSGPSTIAKLQNILAARKASLKRIFNIVILDENGNFLATSGTQGPSLADREFFRHHLQSPLPDAFVGPAIKSRIGGDWLISLSRRFNHPDGSFAGVVFATISSEYFAQFYRQFDIGAHGAITLLSAKGTVLARSVDDGTYVGRDASVNALFTDPSLQIASGAYLSVSPIDGLRRVASFQRGDRFPVLILASREWNEVLAPWRNAAVTRMLFVVSLVMLMALMGLFLVRQLQRGQRMATELAAKEANFRVLAEGSGDMVSRIGLDKLVQYASPSSVRVLGWRPDQLVGTSALLGINPEDLPGVQEAVAALQRGETEEARITFRARHRQRSEIWVEATLRATRAVTGAINGFVAITRDISQQKHLEEKLETLAAMDGLTGLANRRHFDARLLEEWGRAYRERTPLSLLMIDLDHFKAYNDEYGHPAGDECLRVVARVLEEEALRSSDLAARYGGEEFAMLLPNTDAAGCARIGERIRRALEVAGMPHVLNLPSRQVTASLGGAVCWPGIERAAVPASLIEAADQALYAAKDGGRDRLVMAEKSLRPFALASGGR